MKAKVKWTWVVREMLASVVGGSLIYAAVFLFNFVRFCVRNSRKMFHLPFFGSLRSPVQSRRCSCVNLAWSSPPPSPYLGVAHASSPWSIFFHEPRWQTGIFKFNEQEQGNQFKYLWILHKSLRGKRVVFWTLSTSNCLFLYFSAVSFVSMGNYSNIPKIALLEGRGNSPKEVTPLPGSGSPRTELKIG